MFGNNMTTVQLTFTQDQLNVMNAAFSLAPFGQIAPLVTEINRQISQQIAASAVPVEVTE